MWGHINMTSTKCPTAVLLSQNGLDFLHCHVSELFIHRDLDQHCHIINYYHMYYIR